MKTLQHLALAAVVAALGVTSFAQAAVTTSDLTRLETTASEIRQQVDVLKKTDASLAADCEKQLADLTDEITYLRVKMRREGGVTRDEYASLRDRFETLRIRAKGEKVSAQPVMNDDQPKPGVVPVGAQFDVRLQTALNSGTSPVEKRFEATTILDFSQNGTLLIPAGSTVRGFVSSVRPAGKIDRRGSITLSFDEIRVGARSERLRASVTQVMDGKLTDDTKRIGAGAVVGAILGGIIGGGKGALLGVLVGGGGTMAATEGADVDLPIGTILRISLDQPLELAGAN
jgi:hypothetical protein